VTSVTIKTWRSARQSCFFIHIPKTAGMTVRQALRTRYADSERLPAEQWSELAAVTQPLASFKLFQGHFRQFFRSVFPPEARAFTFLREPVERTISHLTHMSADPAFSDVHGLVRGKDLRELIEMPHIRTRCANIQVAYMSDAKKPLTLKAVRDDPEGESQYLATDLASALKNLDELAYVGFNDTLSTDFQRICEMLDLHPPLDLPVSNASKDSNKKEALSDELREMVREANDLDCLFYDAARKKHFDDRPPAPRTTRIESLIDRGVYSLIDARTEFALSDPLPATGLWNTDGPSDRRYRWTGPEPELRFELGLIPGRRYALELQIFCPRDAGELTALVNDKPVPLKLVHVRDKTARATIEVNPALDQRVTSIALRSERVSVASATDSRMIGIVVTGATLRTPGGKPA
jgi:hypothetical protein